MAIRPVVTPATGELLPLAYQRWGYRLSRYLLAAGIDWLVLGMLVMVSSAPSNAGRGFQNSLYCCSMDLHCPFLRWPWPCLVRIMALLAFNTMLLMASAVQLLAREGVPKFLKWPGSSVADRISASDLQRERCKELKVRVGTK
jgi:hypothetical protein